MTARPPASGEPSTEATGQIVVLPPASWAEGAADLLERALYLRSMSSEDAAPVEAAITDHLNHSMRSLARATPPSLGAEALLRDFLDAPIEIQRDVLGMRPDLRRGLEDVVRRLARQGDRSDD